MLHRTFTHRASVGLVTFLLANIILAVPAAPQVENVQKRKSGLPKFYLDALSFSADTLGSRLDVYVQVPYEELHFLKLGALFEAKYEVGLAVLTPGNQLVAEKSWLERVRVKSFEETVARKAYSLIQRSFSLPAGNYVVRAQVRDSESRRLYYIERETRVPDFSEQALTMSDIMLVSKLTEDGGTKNIVPNISGNVGDSPEGFHLFFETYNRTDLDTIALTYKILSARTKQPAIPPRTRVEHIERGRTQIFIKVDSLSLPLGDYELALEATKPIEEGEKRTESTVLSKTQRSFSIHWAGVPFSIADLDLAIDQMRYITKDSEMEYLKEAETMEEKQRRFVDFWKKKDPTPGTEQNEAMEEYFGRVEYANEHFGRFSDGWRTDMGMVYILFGPPSSVDRHPFEKDSKPYEIWYYYDQNRRFVFVDRTGFGDYRLVTPMWEVWQRR